MPSLRDEEAWLAKATPSQAAEVVGAVVAMTSADMDSGAITTLAQMVIRRGYTAAELAYAMEEMMYDPQLAKDLSFRNHIAPADFERVIKPHRRLRRKLQAKLTLYERNKLIDEFPDLEPDDFGITDYTHRNEPLYRYKGDPETKSAEPHPVLESNERPGMDRQRDEKHGPVSAGDAMKAALDSMESNNSADP